MTQAAQLLRLLRDAPGTSTELAAVSGLPLRVVSAYLSRLHGRGRLSRTQRAGQRAYVYAWRCIKPCAPWTTREIATLRSMAGRPAREVAARLGRGVNAVHKQAARQGVSLPAVWPSPSQFRQREQRA